MLTVCYFKDCHQPVQPGSWKCIYHRRRTRCLVEECTNQVYARNLCVRHGGQKSCCVQGCCRNARQAGFCYRHSGDDSRRRCSFAGCVRKAILGGKCISHGGAKMCTIEGCSSHVRKKGLCCRHYRLWAADEEKNKANAPASGLVKANPTAMMQTQAATSVVSSDDDDNSSDDGEMLDLIDANFIDQVFYDVVKDEVRAWPGAPPQC
ncbi:hypothetical protein SDRG_16718 [Saprolegnia diclina VS20]|uniref:WRKY transcription factor 19 n=1 Tax=Saprolegnia diclina (strain VS20) TaxID=1156394 RepID=T0PT32_SAPDV|nr:hypothetical protein SDRG_16718 [Saprolegnia diclina VS20]EQC25391.1 hypothetical protein SDRG_16718 [Saprolegnia diclina VS20]|eukprot:XP_008621158.1 hypothetical protein SDRG_16718 [Saprolegnia diclina VS20]